MHEHPHYVWCLLTVTPVQNTNLSFNSDQHGKTVHFPFSFFVVKLIMAEHKTIEKQSSIMIPQTNSSSHQD